MVDHPVGDACPPTPPPDPEYWREWATRPIPPDVLEAYQKWRVEHELGVDPDPTSLEARFWWWGRESAAAMPQHELIAHALNYLADKVEQGEVVIRPKPG